MVAEDLTAHRNITLNLVGPDCYIYHDDVIIIFQKKLPIVMLFVLYNE